MKDVFLFIFQQSSDGHAVYYLLKFAVMLSDSRNVTTAESKTPCVVFIQMCRIHDIVLGKEVFATLQLSWEQFYRDVPWAFRISSDFSTDRERILL